MGNQKRDLDKLQSNRLGQKGSKDQAELRSGRRRHETVEVRQVLSWLAVKEFSYSGAEVARYLGVTNSCVTRAVSTPNRPDVRSYV